MFVGVQAVEWALEEKNTASALVLALRLSEPKLIKKCVEAVHPHDIASVVTAISVKYLSTLCSALADYLEKSPHLEFLLLWCQVLILTSYLVSFYFG